MSPTAPAGPGVVGEHADIPVGPLGRVRTCSGTVQYREPQRCGRGIRRQPLAQLRRGHGNQPTAGRHRRWPDLRSRSGPTRSAHPALLRDTVTTTCSGVAECDIRAGRSRPGSSEVALGAPGAVAALVHAHRGTTDWRRKAVGRRLRAVWVWGGAVAGGCRRSLRVAGSGVRPGRRSSRASARHPHWLRPARG